MRVRTHESRRRRADHRRRPAPVAEVEVQRRPRREGAGGAVRPRTRAVRGRTHAEGLGVGSPAKASAAKREPGFDDENDDANEDADVALAFDAESLDEAISLDRGGGVEGAEVWLSSATLVVLPPVLISHWLEQIAFTTAGAADGPSVRRRRRRREARRRRGIVRDRRRGRRRRSMAVRRRGRDSGRFALRARRRGGDGVVVGFGVDGGWVFEVDPRASAPRRAPVFRRRVSSRPRVSLGRGAHPRESAERRVFARGLASVARAPATSGARRGTSTRGASAITAKLSVACALRAHARWVMTGTPTPATLRGAGVGHLQPLLAFLRQPPFGSSQQLWMQAIQKPLESAPRGNGGNAKGGARKGGKSTERKGLRASERRRRGRRRSTAPPPPRRRFATSRRARRRGVARGSRRPSRRVAAPIHHPNAQVRHPPPAARARGDPSVVHARARQVVQRDRVLRSAFLARGLGGPVARGVASEPATREVSDGSGGEPSRGGVRHRRVPGDVFRRGD